MSGSRRNGYSYYTCACGRDISTNNTARHERLTCTAKLGPRPPTVTDLERRVLRQIVDGVDPWRGRLGGSRKVSQAIGRLLRKGMISDNIGDVRAATPAGRAALDRHTARAKGASK